MTERTELTAASRAELLTVIAAQRGTITALEQAVTILQARVADLERRLGSSGGGGMPGLKSAATTRSRTTGQPRKRRRQAFVRRRSVPTRTVDHAAATCPDCGTPLRGGWLHRRREVIDLPLNGAEVVEHRFLARHCGVCQRRVLPAPTDLGVAAGQQRLGRRLVSLIVTLRTEQRLPVRAIQRHLASVYGVHLSLGALVGAVQRVATVATPVLAEIDAALRAGSAVNLDETGWREAGRNGYVWTASTPTACRFRYGTRQKHHVAALLGEDFAGVLVSDFYAAYHHYPGLKQKCWAHVLREGHDLTSAYPNDRALRRWLERLKRLFADAKAIAQAVATAPERPRVAAQRQLEARLTRLCARPATDPAAVQGRLSRRLLRHLSDLFTFVAVPGVPADNNGAERSLRHLVTCRKISGGSRSRRGTEATLVLASLGETWRRRGLNPFQQTLGLLHPPQP
jgi:transposase